MSRARARACRRFWRVSRSANLVISSGLTGLDSSERFFTSRGGGALENAAGRLLCTSAILPAGHSLSALAASGEMHSVLRSAGLASVAALEVAAQSSSPNATVTFTNALLELISNYLPHAETTRWR